MSNVFLQLPLFLFYTTHVAKTGLEILSSKYLTNFFTYEEIN